MRRSEAHAIRPDVAARPVIAAASLTLLMVALAIVLFTAMRTPLKDDIAWLLYVARRWMAGRELYVDVVEVNPPLIIWISAIPIRISALLGIDPQRAAIPFFATIVLACAAWTAALLRPCGTVFRHPLPVFAAIGTVLLLVPGDDLGQREHLLVAAALPYLALFARRLDGERLTLAMSIAAGVLAGLGCALKPRYAAVFLALEVLALFRGSRPWHAMPLAAAGTLITYAGLVELICPAYMRRAVPLALALYGATDVPFRHLLRDSAGLLFGEAVAVLLCWHRFRRREDRTLLLTLVVFAVTATVVCFLDGKDWYYHRLPATIATILALLTWAATTSLRRRAEIWPPALLAGSAFVLLMIAVLQRLQPEVALAVTPERSTVTRLEELIRTEHAHTYIAFSEWIALGFPVVNNTGVAWASRFDSMWALKGELWRARFDPAATKDWPVSHWVANDFVAGCPDLAVVDTREGVNYIDVISNSDPAFARAWSRYRLIAAFDGLTVYHRAPGGCR